jgi:hypothetical protein
VVTVYLIGLGDKLSCYTIWWIVALVLFGYYCMCFSFGLFDICIFSFLLYEQINYI